MKIKAAILGLVIILALFSAVTIFAAPDPPPYNLIVFDQGIVVKDGGIINLGDPLSKVYKIMGQPTWSGRDGRSVYANYENSKLLFYAFVDGLFGAPENSDPSVYSIEIASSDFVTLEGVKIGDFRERVVGVYRSNIISTSKVGDDESSYTLIELGFESSAALLYFDSKDALSLIVLTRR